MSDLIIPIKPEVLALISQDIALPGKMYLQEANIYLPETAGKLPRIEGRFDIAESGHFSFDPGSVHATDSEVAAAQLGYAFLIQGSLDGLITKIPTRTIDYLSAIIRDKKGGAWRAEGHVKSTGALPKVCVGCMNLTSVIGNGDSNKRIVETDVLMGNRPYSHKMELTFVVNF